MYKMMLTVGMVAVLFGCTASPAPNHEAPPYVDEVLTQMLQDRIADFEGDVGLYVRHMPTGRMVALNADTLFPTASLIKVPIMLKLFDRMAQGDFGYHDAWIYRDSLLYPGVDILGSFKDGEEIDVAKVAMLMITTSDNTASLWCQHMAGTGTAINAWLAENGYDHTRVNSRTEGRRADWERYGWGQTTPREIAEMLVQIRQGRAVDAAASEEMYRLLTRIYWNDEALSQIPPTIQVASKQGAVSASRSEVLLVNAPSGDYVFSVITKNQKDTSWHYDNAGFVLLREISRMLWQYFEPTSTWQPAAGMDRYW